MEKIPAAQKISALVKRGVRFLAPQSVYVDPSLDPKRVAAGVIVHPGCRLVGAETSLGPDCVIGEETPATVENCQLGRNVRLRGGFFSGSTFLDHASCGSAAHVRPGCLIEEQSSCAHAVGLKQTILMPFVTVGSLVNFCDALMGGGTDRRNHSEVGSSFVHFNYTPRQDKAAPSLVGDVPRGVMLDQPPIFLGGQGGLVGPARIQYGTVLAAGTVCRRDVLEGCTLVFGGPGRHSQIPFVPRQGGNTARIVLNNLVYLGNILALEAWYAHVRARFLDRSDFGRACREGALARIRSVFEERVRRLGELADKVADAPRGARRTAADEPETFARRWPGIREALRRLSSEPAEPTPGNAFAKWLAGPAPASDYLDAVRSLSPAVKAAGTAWLQSVVDSAAGLWQQKSAR
jgi:UDP-N-acetylglucosamine/UDP-N-acetylgalactosamine diphosphorylase